VSPELDPASADADPFSLFARWYDEAAGTARDLDAVALATVGPDGAPHVRMVLLRARGPADVGFFTNRESQKGADLAANPRAAIVWYSEATGRQVRIEGTVTEMSEDRSDSYFAQRPRAHQVAARASAQSRIVGSRLDLEEAVSVVEAEFAGRRVDRPSNWGGYALHPRRFEFWQQRPDRLHDRVQYERGVSGWTKSRLGP
jgi:pyridoxamine 5'-phosphate oxidase